MPILHRDSQITPRALDLFILAEQIHTQFPPQGRVLEVAHAMATFGFTGRFREGGKVSWPHPSSPQTEVICDDDSHMARTEGV